MHVCAQTSWEVSQKNIFVSIFPQINNEKIGFFHFPIWFCSKTISCSGSNLKFTITTKKTYFVKDQQKTFQQFFQLSNNLMVSDKNNCQTFLHRFMLNLFSGGGHPLFPIDTTIKIEFCKVPYNNYSCTMFGIKKNSNF